MASLSEDEWKQYCSAILSVEKFQPKEFEVSGPKHNITLLPTGFNEEGVFFAFDDATKKDFLTSLKEGTKPPEYAGGKCPHTVIVKGGDGLNAWLGTLMDAEKKRVALTEADGRSPKAPKSAHSCVSDLSLQFPVEGPADMLRSVAQFAEEEGVNAIDVYGEGQAVQSLECDVASRLGKPRALWFPTGSSAQVAALQSHAILANKFSGAPLPTFLGGSHVPTVALHPTSHIVHHQCLLSGTEQFDALQANRRLNLSDFAVLPFGNMATAASLDDVRGVLRDAEQRGIVLVALALEVPQRMNGGAVIPFGELQQVRALTKEKGIALHMDGARLWDVQPFFDRPLNEICALFDSVYVSFYKGIGGMAGAILAANEELITAARERRDTIGAKMFCATPYALHCHMQLRRNIGTFATRFKRLREMVALIQALIVTHASGKVRFEPPEPQSCLVHVYLCGEQSAIEDAHNVVVKQQGVRLWNRLRGSGHSTKGECYFEWSMGPQNAAVSDEDLCRGWKTLLSTFYA